MATSGFWGSVLPLYAAAGATVLVGGVTSYVAARNTRRTLATQLRGFEQQRLMALDDRVWSHRANAYAEALTLLHKMIRAWDSGAVNKQEGLDEFRRSYDYQPAAELLARISAFGSPAAVETFESGYRNIYDAAQSTEAMRVFAEAHDGEQTARVLREAHNSAATARVRYSELS